MRTRTSAYTIKRPVYGPFRYLLTLWRASRMTALAKDRRLFIRFTVGSAVFAVFRGGAITSRMSTLFSRFGHYSSPPCRLDSGLAPLISDIRLGFDMSLPTFLTWTLT